VVNRDLRGWRGDLGQDVAPARVVAWNNASLPSLLHGRKKIALTVQYSGFAAFGHPARQSSLANGTY
jgi:hypothetical protein